MMPACESVMRSLMTQAVSEMHYFCISEKACMQQGKLCSFDLSKKADGRDAKLYTDASFLTATARPDRTAQETCKPGVQHCLDVLLL